MALGIPDGSPHCWTGPRLFFELNQRWTVEWHRAPMGPVAYIRTNDHEAAEAFRARFGGKWLLTEERMKETGRIFSSQTW